MPQAASMPISREPQHHLAARDVGAGIGDELPRRDRAAHIDCERIAVAFGDQLGVLDHDHGIGAAGNDAACGDRRCRTGLDLERRRMPAGDHFAVETKAARRGVARPRGVDRAQREAVDVGAIERRHVDRRGDVMREHTAERGRERDRLVRKRREIQVPGKAHARFLGGDHFEKLLLASGPPDRGDQVMLGRARFDACRHGQGLITTSLPGGYPSLSGGTSIKPSACASADSGT
jgi:hypothetical protein